MTLTATWLLPLAIIPGTWQVYEDTGTSQITKGQASSQPRSGETDSAVSAESQSGGPIEENVPEPKTCASQEPDRNWQTWGPLSSSYISKHQPSKGHWDPSPSVMQIHPQHGCPNPTHSDSSSFHYTYSHYPPGAYFMPTFGYPMPMHSYYQPLDPEQTPELYEPTVYEPAPPPPVVLRTISLPDTASRPQSSPAF